MPINLNEHFFKNIKLFNFRPICENLNHSPLFRTEDVNSDCFSDIYDMVPISLIDSSESNLCLSKVKMLLLGGMRFLSLLTLLGQERCLYWSTSTYGNFPWSCASEVDDALLTQERHAGSIRLAGSPLFSLFLDSVAFEIVVFFYGELLSLIHI